ncbi:uncharacterized protein LOC111695671 [Eurytemora carolleeae]|uniref:uncharacterized protein LOC111695671 n=1 Tax=Eurytemora carolleeae TaxID=1294199 RepID=UPI000C761D87|nr:uncharacterized protein LOC111695671 [Eurytemora carolleeae]|eukprot:XP_023320838.1 uncharacterized protein LOC111695671 [Eurytemora affinis]
MAALLFYLIFVIWTRKVSALVVPPNYDLDEEFYKKYEFTSVTRCVFENGISFLCPYAAIDIQPPWPNQQEVKYYTECCKDKCCTKEGKELFLSTERPGWCYDFIVGSFAAGVFGCSR